MTNKTTKTYFLDAGDKAVISKHFTDHMDWDKSAFSDLKEKIKKELRILQANKCCYCKKELGLDIKEVDIEHIVPKSTYPKFTFRPINLALSCPACNTIKGRKDVLLRPIVNYPRNGSNFKIIHAYFDDYDNSIRILDGLIYQAIDEKGSFTIDTCQLWRLYWVEEEAKKMGVKTYRYGSDVEQIRKSDLKETNILLKELMQKLNKNDVKL